MPAAQIDEVISDEDEKPDDEEKKTGGGSRVPGGRRRTVFDNELQQMRYEELIDLIKENNKEE